MATRQGAMHTPARPAIFLDRDGVIIENRDDYVKSWGEVRFVAGAFAALQRLSRSGHALVIVTNQSAVGRGIISLEQAIAINREVVARIAEHGGRIDAVYLCPHHPTDGCICRKPQPGMLRRAGQELGLDLSRSYLIGDAASDLEAARAAGVQGILVLTGRGREQVAHVPVGQEDTPPVFADLTAALNYIDPTTDPSTETGQ